MIRGTETVLTTFEVTPKSVDTNWLNGKMELKVEVIYLVEAHASVDRFDNIEVDETGFKRLFPEEYEVLNNSIFIAELEEYCDFRIIKEEKSSIKWDYDSFEQEPEEDTEAYDRWRDNNA